MPKNTELAKRYDICNLHQLQRAVLYALGLAGKQIKNLEARRILQLHCRQVQASHQSGSLFVNLQKHRTDAGVLSKDVLFPVTTRDTRW